MRHGSRLLAAIGASTLAFTGASVTARADIWSATVGEVGKAVEQTAHNVGNTAQTVGHTVEKAVDDAGHTVQTAVQDAGHAIEKGAHDSGHAVQEVGSFVEKHPWETVAAVVLVAGGCYLIIYEGYTLTVSVEGVQVLSVTSHAISGYVVGGTLAGGGSAVLAVATVKSPVGSVSTPLYEGTDPAPKTVLLAPVTGGEGLSPVPMVTPPVAAPSVDGANSQSVPLWPRLRDSPSAFDRFDYAIAVSKWAEQVDPIGPFDPRRSPQMTQAELKLLDALTNLYAIPDTDGSRRAKEQSENIVLNFSLDQANDKVKEQVIKGLLGETIARVFSGYGNVITAISPVVIADDAINLRDRLIHDLSQQLNAYARKRDPQSAFRPQKLVPDFPFPQPQMKPGPLLTPH